MGIQQAFPKIARMNDRSPKTFTDGQKSNRNEEQGALEPMGGKAEANGEINPMENGPSRGPSFQAKWRTSKQNVLDPNSQMVYFCTFV
jgi:hypothetical protein